jgi:hypothetical protein
MPGPDDGELKWKRLQQQEWGRESARREERRREALHWEQRRHDLYAVERAVAPVESPAARRLPMAIGTLLVRTGQRLQGQAQASASVH